MVLLRFSMSGILLASVLTMAGAAQQEQNRKQNGKSAAPAASPAPVDPPITGGSAPVDPKTYKIGPEDVLGIRVFSQPEMSGPVTVRPDGMITPRWAKDMQVNGLTPDQVAARLTATYGESVRDPVVQVEVLAVRSKRYIVTGPGMMLHATEFQLLVPTKVSEALHRAGQFNDFAKKDKILIRRGNTVFKFNYNDWMKGKKLEADIYLEAGDTIIVQ